MRLFCFPYAGAGAGVYRPWSKLLPDSIELCALQPPGHEARIGEAPLNAVADLAAGAFAAMAPLLDKPFAIFGHSLGALVAYETTRLIATAGAAMPLVLVVSGHRAPQLPLARSPLYQLPDAAFIREVLSYNGTPVEVLQSAELVELLLPVLRADFQAADTYEMPPGARVSCGLRAFASCDDDHVAPEAVEAWRDVTTAAFSMHRFPGDHFFLNAHRDAVVADVVSTVMDAWQTGRPASPG